jgi:chitin disaccharide deacetylase
MMKKIIINVDDLGFSHAVNDAVVDLAQSNRIHATSFMSLGDIDYAQLQELQSHKIDIGLHFDLTGLAQYGQLKQVLYKAYFGKFSEIELNRIIHKQLDLFESKIGCVPDFVDGHQHVHQFPQVRHALFKVLQSRYQIKIPIRNTKSFQSDFKSKIIYVLGGISMKRMLTKMHWPHNASFGGIYDFSPDLAVIKKIWKKWLVEAPHQAVIMCHPAKANHDWKDDIYHARCLEYEWLMSDEFLQLWQDNHCEAHSWKMLTEHIK